MAKIDDLARLTVGRGGSDLHLKLDSPPAIRTNGAMERLPEDDTLSQQDTDAMLAEILPDSLSGEFTADGEALNVSSQPQNFRLMMQSLGLAAL